MIFTAIAYPLVISMILFHSFSLTQRFGILSITGACFLLINTLTSIIPNEYLLPTVPFYVLNIIPFIVADVILSFTRRSYLQYVAGGILGSSFFLAYYPLITYVFNEVFDHKAFPPSEIAPVFSELLIDAYPLFVIPSILAGSLAVGLYRYVILYNKTKVSIHF